MSNIQIIVGTLGAMVIIGMTYTIIGWRRVRDCYQLWCHREYWVPYNRIEALAWMTKAMIIVPGLIFKVDIWWLYIFALFTSVSLMWASNKKLLPTLVGFNSLWVWLSCMVLAQHLF